MGKTSIKGAIQDLSEKAGKPTAENALKAIKAAQDAAAAAQTAAAAAQAAMNAAQEAINGLGYKVDIEAGKGLSANDYTTTEKNKLAVIEAEANKYIHPETHPATMISEDTTHRFATDTEKASWDAKLDASIIGQANGAAELDGSGKVPASQLPSYVDDVEEYADYASLPATGESGKIYIALDTNKTYRWTGSSYQVVSETIALGETEATAYRGDRGKEAYDHSQSSHAPVNALPLSGGTLTGGLDIAGHDLKNHIAITTDNGNTYATYPFGFSYSAIGGVNDEQLYGDDFPGYGLVVTCKRDEYSLTQMLYGANDTFKYYRDYYDGSWNPWRRLTGPPKLLWSGAWTGAGTLTVSNFSDYKLFLIRIAGTTLMITAISVSGYLRGLGGYALSTSHHSVSLNCTYSGNVLTWVYCNRFSHLDNDDHNAFATYDGGSCTLSEIWGVA